MQEWLISSCSRGNQIMVISSWCEISLDRDLWQRNVENQCLSSDASWNLWEVQIRNEILTWEVGDSFVMVNRVWASFSGFFHINLIHKPDNFDFHWTTSTGFLVLRPFTRTFRYHRAVFSCLMILAVMTRTAGWLALSVAFHNASLSLSSIMIAI